MPYTHKYTYQRAHAGISQQSTPNDTVTCHERYKMSKQTTRARDYSRHFAFNVQQHTARTQVADKDERHAEG